MVYCFPIFLTNATTDMSMLPSIKLVTEGSCHVLLPNKENHMDGASTPNTMPGKGMIFVIRQSFVKGSQLKLLRFWLQP